MEWTEAFTLDDYVRKLLKDGKRSKHEDFQRLFLMLGEKKIREIAARLLAEEARRPEST